jgi:hypothetical protein
MPSNEVIHFHGGNTRLRREFQFVRHVEHLHRPPASVAVASSLVAQDARPQEGLEPLAGAHAEHARAPR